MCAAVKGSRQVVNVNGSGGSLFLPGWVRRGTVTPALTPVGTRTFVMVGEDTCSGLDQNYREFASSARISP